MLRVTTSARIIRGRVALQGGAKEMLQPGVKRGVRRSPGGRALQGAPTEKLRPEMTFLKRGARRSPGGRAR